MSRFPAGFFEAIAGEERLEASQPPPVKAGVPVPAPEEVFAEGKEIALQLTTIKHRLGQLGLFRSMHAMDACTGALGYELADLGVR